MREQSFDTWDSSPGTERFTVARSDDLGLLVSEAWTVGETTVLASEGSDQVESLTKRRSREPGGESTAIDAGGELWGGDEVEPEPVGLRLWERFLGGFFFAMGPDWSPRRNRRR